MQVMNTCPIVAPEALRPWVQDCLALLGVSAASLSRQSGLGRNTLGDFLGQPGRDIALSSAHVITCKLREIAADRAVQLPRLEGARNA